MISRLLVRFVERDRMQERVIQMTVQQSQQLRSLTVADQLLQVFNSILMQFRQVVHLPFQTLVGRKRERK